MRPYVGTLGTKPRPRPLFGDGVPRVVVVSTRTVATDRTHAAADPSPEGYRAPTTRAPVAVERGPSFRALLPEGGAVRTVRWGEFAPFLQAQVDDSSERNAEDTVACRVQVYEALTPQRIAELAHEIAYQTGIRAPLARLSAPLQARLGLDELAPGPQPARSVWKERDVALPHERYVRLVAEPTSPRGTRPGNGGALPAPAAFRGWEAGETDSGPESAIPERYRQPWEFQRTREEALLDMAGEGRGLAALTRPFARLWSRVGRSARIWRWRALLSGRAISDQLWGVRLPPRGYCDPDIRRWAERTLTSGGLDPVQWMMEWEIYWRRKGV